jgi:tetratricopeptide (TPR) repeat protein
MRYEETLAAFRRGDDAEAVRLAALDVEEARSAGDEPALVNALCMLSRVALRQGDLAEVAALAGEAEHVARRSGDQRLGRMPLHMRAVAARMNGQWDEGRQLYRRSIALNEALGEVVMAAAEHRNLAYLELHAGNSDRARELFAAAAERLQDVDAPALVPYLIFDQATVAAMDGDYEVARRGLAAALKQWADDGVLPDPDDAAEIARLQVALQETPGRPEVGEKP